MQPKTISEWIALVTTISAIVTGVYLFVRKTYRKFKLLCVLANQPWQELFGDEFVQELRDLIDDLTTAQSLSAIRADLLFEQLNLGLYICDADTGACLYVSDFLATEIFGLAPSKMLGSGWTEAIVDREEKVHTWEYCCKRKIDYNSSYSVRNAITHKMVHCITKARYIPIDGGRYVGWVKVLIQ